MVASRVDRVSAGEWVDRVWSPRLEFQTGHDLLWAIGQARARVLRTMEAFAEAEIVIPDGPFVGQKYSCEKQPYSRLWFRAIDVSEGRLESGVRSLEEAPPCPPASGGVITGGTPVPHSSESDGLGDACVVAWRNFIAVGPTQSGKTLTCLIIPVMYHLFEVEETVICVVPDINMVDDKWKKDFLPAIQASRYRALLPTRGEGSRGGTVTNSITFGNGVTLKFMTAGGGDTNRAAFTSRIVAITELNKFGKRKESSSEADMFRQIRGRMRAYGDRARLYGECTVTTEHGLVWTEYSNGTASRIAAPCPHCEEYVTPGREQLVGWESAKSAVEAEQLAQWCCPKCGVLLTDRERRRMVKRSVLVHKGQEIEASGFRIEASGKRKKGPKSPLFMGGISIVGEAPATFTFGLRWSAFDNLFLSTGYLGSGEWTARHLADNAENAEREQLQFVWALPVPDTAQRSMVLTANEICLRQGRFARGVIPTGCGLVAFLDLGKYRCHWVVLAGSRGGRGEGTTPAPPQAGGEITAGTAVPHSSMRYWLVDCGVIRTDVGPLSERDGLTVAMREFHEICEAGWVAAGDGDLMAGERWSPALRYVDSGKWTTEVYEFMLAMAREGHEGYFPTKGHGASQDQGARVYREKTAHSERVLVIGDRYHLARQEVTAEDGQEVEIALMHVDVDTWKKRVHAALDVDAGAPGSLMLWRDDWREHMPMARALTAEVAVEDFDPDKGMVTTWQRKHKENHFFDGVVGCAAGLDYLGYLEEESGDWSPESGGGSAAVSARAEVPSGRLLGEVNFGGALKR